MWFRDLKNLYSRVSQATVNLVLPLSRFAKLLKITLSKFAHLWKDKIDAYLIILLWKIRISIMNFKYFRYLEGSDKVLVYYMMP